MGESGQKKRCHPISNAKRRDKSSPLNQQRSRSKSEDGKTPNLLEGKLPEGPLTKKPKKKEPGKAPLGGGG